MERKDPREHDQVASKPFLLRGSVPGRMLVKKRPPPPLHHGAFWLFNTHGGRRHPLTGAQEAQWGEAASAPLDPELKSDHAVDVLLPTSVSRH